MSAYYTLLTKVGLAKLTNAQSSGSVVQWSQMAVGDGNGAAVTPTETQTALVHETYRASINRLAVDDTNPNYLIAELVIPAPDGGFTIREIGIFDTEGNLVAVANSPENYKPVLSEGSATDLVVRVIVMLSNTDAVQLKIDPSVVLATRKYVDDSITTALNKQDGKQSVRLATTAAIALTGLQVIDGVQLVSGDRVLVKDQAAGKDNGIYIAASGAWSRASDADASIEVTPGLFVTVELGTANADSLWQLVTDGAITLGTTALAFEMLTGKTGVAAGTYDSITVNARGMVIGATVADTPAQFDSSKKKATTEFVQRAMGNMRGYAAVGASRSITANDLGKLLFVDTNGSTITLPTPSSLGATPGQAVEIFTTTASATLIPGAGTQVNHVGTSTVASIALLPAQSLKVVAVTGTAWQTVASTCGLGQNADFAALKAVSGYQKLPSGIIIQWGGYSPIPANSVVDVTYPITFPNGAFVPLAGLNSQSTSSTAGQVSAYNLSASQIRIANSTAISQSVWWVAIGR